MKKSANERLRAFFNSHRAKLGIGKFSSRMNPALNLSSC